MGSNGLHGPRPANHVQNTKCELLMRDLHLTVSTQVVNPFQRSLDQCHELVVSTGSTSAHLISLVLQAGQEIPVSDLVGSSLHRVKSLRLGASFLQLRHKDLPEFLRLELLVDLDVFLECRDKLEHFLTHRGIEILGPADDELLAHVLQIHALLSSGSDPFLFEFVDLQALVHDFLGFFPTLLDPFRPLFLLFFVGQIPFVQGTHELLVSSSDCTHIILQKHRLVSRSSRTAVFVSPPGVRVMVPRIHSCTRNTLKNAGKFTVNSEAVLLLRGG